MCVAQKLSPRNSAAASSGCAEASASGMGCDVSEDWKGSMSEARERCERSGRGSVRRHRAVSQGFGHASSRGPSPPRARGPVATRPGARTIDDAFIPRAARCASPWTRRRCGDPRPNKQYIRSDIPILKMRAFLFYFSSI